MKIENFELKKWYPVARSKTPIDLLIAHIKKRIDDYGDFEFNEDYTQFRRIQNWEEFISSLEGPNKINFHFDFHSMDDVVFDYSSFENNEPTKMGHKEWSKKVGRNI